MLCQDPCHLSHLMNLSTEMMLWGSLSIFLTSFLQTQQEECYTSVTECLPTDTQAMLLKFSEEGEAEWHTGIILRAN